MIKLIKLLQLILGKLNNMIFNKEEIKMLKKFEILLKEYIEKK